MARITIDDLPQSDDLDREAMQSILGGGLSRVPPRQVDEVGSGSGPIVDYPPGFGGRSRRARGRRDRSVPRAERGRGLSARDKVRAVLAPTSR